MDRAYDQCRTILQENAEKMKIMVKYLLEHETMSGEQFRDCMEGKPIQEMAEGSTLFDAYQEPPEPQET